MARARVAPPAHCQRVARLLARVLGALATPPEVRQLGYLAGLLHDVGKLIVDPGVLDHPGRLPPEHRRQIHAHPLASARLAREAGMAEAVVAALRAHHERWDGRGYPAGLRGPAIPWLARGLPAAAVFIVKSFTCAFIQDLV